MAFGSRIYQRFHTLSLDVVIGALGAATFVGFAWDVRPTHLHLILLALATWLVYTLDHLLDAERIRGSAQNPRHAYFQRNRTWLWWVWAAVAVSGTLLGGWAVWHNRTLLILGGWACALVAVHLVVVAIFSRTGVRWLPKEFTVAFIYSYAVAIPALVSQPRLDPGFAGLFFAQLVLISWMNLLIYSRFELDFDVRDGQLSVVRSLGTEYTDLLVTLLLLCNLAVSLWLAYRGVSFHHRQVSYWMGLATFLEALVVVFPAFFARHDHYRLWAEAVFMLPLLLWVV